MKPIKTEIRVIKRADREKAAVRKESAAEEMSDGAIKVAVTLTVSEWLNDFNRRKRRYSRRRIKLPQWLDR